MDPNDTLSEALKLIDPSSTLVPGSSQYEVIVEMIESRIRKHGPEEALEMARTGARHLSGWRKFL
jgi:hypothetical protein